MRVVQIYVGDKGQKLDLFGDENISVTSTGQSLTDLTGTIADFSQTFTVPASPINNQIFEHYYNNDVDGTIDHNLRRESRIEIDYIPFRTGKLQLEKGEVVDGKVENYTATFYGEVVTLKDKIGELKLSDLNYSTINHSYTDTQVRNRINGTTNDAVRYPLVSSLRNWTYGGGSNNIANTGTGIDYTELNPAVYINSIFSLINAQLGVSFVGAWLLSDHFQKLLLWYKNSEAYIYTSQPYDLYNDGDVIFDNGYIYGDIQFYYRDPASLPTTPPYVNNINIRHNITVTVNTVSTSDYYLDVYRNGTKISSLFQAGGNKVFNVLLNQTNPPQLNELYSFKIRSTAVATFTGSLNYFINYDSYDLFNAVSASVSYTNPFETVVTAINTNLSALAPDIKIIDLIRGIADFAKMVIVPESDGVYKFMPVDDFYNSGTVRNITQYVQDELITVARPELYKVIDLKYKESKSILNTAFYDINSRHYGDARQTYDYAGSEYTVELPFEIILGQKFTGTDLQVGYCLDSALNPYAPNPVLFYERPLQSGVSFWVSGTNLTSYIPFGQDVVIGGATYTSNFNLEVSSFSLNPEPNGLYNTYYSNTISNLYSQKTRFVSLKTVFPLSILTTLKLNDTLIIRDKAYIIIDMNNNLTTGECNLRLLTWFNIIDFNEQIELSSIGSTIVFGFDLSDGTTVTLPDVEAAFVTLTQESVSNNIVAFTASYGTNDVSTREEYHPIQFTQSDRTVNTYILGFTQKPV